MSARGGALIVEARFDLPFTLANRSFQRKKIGKTKSQGINPVFTRVKI
jgi:hypothetical protein